MLFCDSWEGNPRIIMNKYAPGKRYAQLHIPQNRNRISTVSGEAAASERRRRERGTEDTGGEAAGRDQRQGEGLEAEQRRNVRVAAFSVLFFVGR
jgi:hypothetical protein